MFTLSVGEGKSLARRRRRGKRVVFSVYFYAIARLVMCHWDRIWKDMMRMNRIDITRYMRYKHAIKPGWRWVGGGLEFCKMWYAPDTTKEV